MLLQLEGSRKAGTGGDGLTNEAVAGQGRCSERHVKAEGGDRVNGVETTALERWRDGERESRDEV